MRWVLGPLLLGSMLLAAGCDRERIAAYDAPKDAPPAPSRPMAPHGMGMGMGGDAMPARPGLRWKSLPDGWTSKGPAGMRVATFSINGASGSPADLSVIPLPGTGGSDLDLVNLWRGQLGLAPIEAAALPSHTDETTLAGQTVKLFSIVGSEASDASAKASQILVAALRKDEFTWFFKLAGEASTVAAQRDALKSFLASVEFTAPEAAAPPPMAVASSATAGDPGSGGTPSASWSSVPSGWTEVAAPQMVRNKWKITAEGGSADITVSVFPGDTGGLVPNLNRWRAQVALQPAPEAELIALQDNLDVLGGKGTLVDFVGTNPESAEPLRLLAAVVRRDGFSWFYKLLGSPAAVEAQREAFVRFVQTVQYTRGS